MAGAPQPIQMTWVGNGFRPANDFWQRKGDELFTVGQRYAIIEHQAPSDASRAHFFATLHDLWMSFPPELAAAFPNVEILRKHGLIRTGYCDKRSFVCRSNAEADRFAMFLKGGGDPYAIIEVNGATVTEWTAHSQKSHAMGAKEFNQSKQKILEWVANLIGASMQDVEEMNR